jgi:hypothetical protein
MIKYSKNYTARQKISACSVTAGASKFYRFLRHAAGSNVQRSIFAKSSHRIFINKFYNPLEKVFKSVEPLRNINQACGLQSLRLLGYGEGYSIPENPRPFSHS